MHGCPFAHLPQSALHSSPELALPQISVPSQRPSPQRDRQTPEQRPLMQALSVVHTEPAPREFEEMQVPALQVPLVQAPFALQGEPLGSVNGRQKPKLQTSIPRPLQSSWPRHGSPPHTENSQRSLSQSDAESQGEPSGAGAG